MRISKATYSVHDLQFKFDAGTSRGVLKNKKSYILTIEDEHGNVGRGESGPLPGLSPDFDKAEAKINTLCSLLPSRVFDDIRDIETHVNSLNLNGFPSVKFALETALYECFSGESWIIFRNDFSKGQQSIPINGLVWMGTKEFMLQQIKEKIEKGFDCIKIKVGAIDFEAECALLAYIREHYDDKTIELRLDANGAFSPDHALDKLKALSDYKIHSIEQPIRQGQTKDMARLCKSSPIPIALDEEMIGIDDYAQKESLLKTIQPQFIILKPTLHGGLAGVKEWIQLADDLGISWWITSALESNIGLNAIAQFTAQYPVARPHGLGTGQLYHNNIDSPLHLNGALLSFHKA